MMVIAVAEPVEVGARFMRPERARRRSAFFALGASMIVCVLVTQWIVVSMPRTMPSFSCTTLTSGPRQLVVHEAAVTMLCFAASYLSWIQSGCEGAAVRAEGGRAADAQPGQMVSLGATGCGSGEGWGDGRC